MIQSTLKMEGFSKAQMRHIQTTHGLKVAFIQGLLKSGLFLQAEAQKLCPVDTGALRSSAQTRLEDGHHVTISNVGSESLRRSKIQTKSVSVIVEFTQSYAQLVHEGTHIRFRVGQAKFLEEPARKYQGIMAQIVLDEMKKQNV